ncbi:MAG TPA: cation transporter [Usitatibacter sp.]|nr:cation transporter [Usitatibacter sp.]
MACECGEASAKTEAERKVVRLALSLNLLMFIVGAVAGVLADSTGVLADALDMLTDAIGYALAIAAISRGPAFKANAARWTGGVLLVLGAGVIIEIGRRSMFGSEPVGTIMMVYSTASFAVNLYVLTQLAKVREGGVHLRASYICTRADVLANIAVFISGAIVAVTGLNAVDLLVGLGIGGYVIREAVEIFQQANEALEGEGA